MEKVFYRKYRPKNFKDAVGQEHITATLQQAIKTGKISHAYLFTGPRGVGKTSVARILAHEVNKLPYDNDSFHLDIIEIDAASNRRIDEIRDLRDKVRIAPASAKYKVYIIDEVHMLTKEAFNALLKTLEEPPDHCIFILATTEVHKLPETIISRTQKFEFKPVTFNKVAAHLENIAKQEGINITREALLLLAEFGEGSFRDSIGYLDQLSSLNKKITGEDVSHILGLPTKSEVDMLLSALNNRNAKQIIDSVQSIREKGIGANELAALLAKRLRAMAIEGKLGRAELDLMRELVDVGSSSQPYEFLEIILLQSITKDATSGSKLEVKSEALKLPVLTTSMSAEINHKPLKASSLSTFSSFDLREWPNIVENVKTHAASLYTALRLASPSYADGILTLAFQFPLHQKKMEQSKNKFLLSEIIEKQIGHKLTIECTVDKSIKSIPAVKSKIEKSESTEGLNSITNVFGAAEMIEA